MKKLPPNGTKLERFLASGQKPKNDIYIFCGMYAWRKVESFKNTHHALCLPPYEDPSIYRWPVKGCDVLLFDTGNMEPSEIEEFGYHLLKAGASIVRAVSSDFKLAVYKR